MIDMMSSKSSKSSKSSILFISFVSFGRFGYKQSVVAEMPAIAVTDVPTNKLPLRPKRPLQFC